ncbi:hypothetical protein P171DRAFT_257583 [Karstenula rhodostoma CBS 690.94]|uniref:Uncharacterized protein n=1 Tax=Karstenula rhodostoma CBS 690.94 TaxID=1392251 RepID=A0A9P4PLV2_9PLEO|nr:hypothetical protein P171DRAFT_257583 [Karstenula rhodostoma CBS 690.94]
MPINWQDPEVKDRILASIIASFGTPINCREVARIFGPEATYDAIENFLRKPKKKAKELAAEAAARGTSAPAPAKQQRAPRTPKKSDGVKSGRVTKTTPKKKAGSPVKKELLEGDEDVFGGGAVHTPQDDFEMGEVLDGEV